MLLIVEEETAKQKRFTDSFGPGNPIPGETALRMLRMHRKRLELAKNQQDTGIIDLKDEPDNFFFDTKKLSNFPNWAYMGIGFGLTKLSNGVRNPPSLAEEKAWNANPRAFRVSATTIVGETDEKGNFKFKTDQNYYAFDFAGTCCL